MTELIQAEVRLYFNGRNDWDTEFFTATCPTDLQNKARVIADQHHADHFNCGVRTAETEYQHTSLRRPRIATSPNVKDQVAAIKAAAGLEE